ncbi:cleavage stimulation factor subunit 50-like isoform X3 [Malus domestica]|uniref:cleavage stimulation factor subunit 50-like isoform X3 n=1 Tax=Malus domestica TaxID=3750 RepID=UPI0039764C5A
MPKPHVIGFLNWFRVEKDEMLRGVSLSAYDLGTSVASRYGGIPATRTAAVDFGAVQETKGSPKSFPKHETRHLSERKMCRV